MIKNFDINDSEQLIRIWQVCFGDKREYIESFFAFFKDSMKVGVYVEDGRIVSALYCLESELKFDGKSVRSWYLYAVATLPEYRNRGYAGALIDEVKNADDGRQVLFLTPSSEKNRKYYEKLGFEDRFYCSIYEFEKTQKSSNIELKKREDENLFCVRESVLDVCSHASWDEKHLDFAFGDSTYLAFDSGRKIGYFHCEKKEKTIVIDELCVEEKYIEDVLNKACGILHQKKVKAAAQYGENCCKISKGMIYCKFDSIKKDIEKIQFYLGANLE